MFQQTLLVGNLGSDPLMKYLPDGTPVTNFTIAINKVWYDDGGKKRKKTTWFRVSTWERLAETCAEYLAKGRQVLVIGEMQEPEPFEGRDGAWRANLEIRAQIVRFLGNRDDAVAGKSYDEDGELAEAPVNGYPIENMAAKQWADKVDLSDIPLDDDDENENEEIDDVIVSTPFRR